MFRHYLISTLRNLWRRKLYSAITLLSMIIGLSVFSLIFLHVKWEASYNKGIKNSSNIYRLMKPVISIFPGASPYNTTFPVQDTNNLQEFLGESVAGVVRTQPLSVRRTDIDTENYFRLITLEEGFSDVFDLPVLDGDLNGLFTVPGSIALEQELAEQIFGGEPAVGNFLEIAGGQSASSNADGEIEVSEGEVQEFQVVAVYRLPKPVTTYLNSSALTLRNDFAAKLSPVPTMIENTQVWLRLNRDSDLERVEQELKSYAEQYQRPQQYPSQMDIEPVENTIIPEPINSIYFNNMAGNPAGDLTRVLSFALLGVLVLLAGCSNAVSLGLAGALERTREVGIRKSVGAGRTHVMIQYLGEPFMLAVLSIIPVLLIAANFHPVFANLLSFQELPELEINDYILLSATVLLVGLCVGLYPAMNLSRLRPVQILRPEATQSGGRVFSLRAVMVGIQFSFALFLIVVTSSLYAQLVYTQMRSLGFDYENVVRVAISSDGDNLSTGAVKTLLEQMPGVESVMDASNGPMIQRNDSFYRLSLTAEGADSINASSQSAADGQFAFFNIPLLAGREFSQERDSVDRNQQGGNQQARARQQVDPVIINRSAMKALMFASPEEAVGAQIYRHIDSSVPLMGMSGSPLVIIGVVEDSMFGGVRSETGPEFYTRSADTAGLLLALNRITQFNLKYNPAISDDFQQSLTDYSLQHFGAEPMAVNFLEEVVRDAWRTERRESNLLLLCGLMALVLSCSGLFGLVSINMKTRIKEVGIRKSLGASSMSILWTILKSYSWPVLLANVLAWPVAVYFVLQWIQGFPNQLEKIWLVPICLITSLLVLLIAWVTVSALTYKTASARPVLALRYE